VQGGGHAPALRRRLEGYLGAKGLKLNAAKTRTLNVQHESFRFLGFEVTWRKSPRTATLRPREPSSKSQAAVRETVREALNHWTLGKVARPKCAGSMRCCADGVDTSITVMHTDVPTGPNTGPRNGLRAWFWQKYGRTHSRYGFFTNARLVGQYGLYQLPLLAPGNRQPTGERSGKPDAGNPPVRFDEGREASTFAPTLLATGKPPPGESTEARPD